MLMAVSVGWATMKAPHTRKLPCVLLACLALQLAGGAALAQTDNAQLISVSVPPGTSVMPRTKFTQTWTIKNTGTTTWSPGQSGYTLNLVGADSLGAVPLSVNTHASWYTVAANIGSGASVAPGAQATFTLSFIAPEAAGSVTDTFQLNSASNSFFGPQFAVQINVMAAGSTNQYDRARVVAYANKYAGFVVSDGYFWTNGSSYANFGVHAAVPTAYLGDDCAHFVSCCIGSQAAERGGGLKIPSRVPPTYGEPGAGRLVNTCLIAAGYAKEVFSLNDLSPGDVIGWNWEGDTNIANLDHVTLYLGNGLLASHAESALDVSATTFFQDSLPDWRWHLIHIFDAPTIASQQAGNNLVLSWGTNWTGYALYSSPSLATNATWTKVTKTPAVVGASNVLTNAMSGGSLFYRLQMH